jgi:hypothetical protein
MKRTASAALLTGSGDAFQLLATAPKQTCGVRVLKKPVAIAMWDFSWLLRHDPGCEFADWDETLDGLVKRGYNAGLGRDRSGRPRKRRASFPEGRMETGDVGQSIFHDHSSASGAQGTHPALC